MPPPLDKLATAIGVQGRFMTLPGALGVAEKKVPVLYLMIAALLVRTVGGSIDAGVYVKCITSCEKFVPREMWTEEVQFLRRLL